MTRGPAAAPAPAADGLWIALGALVAYLVLRQHSGFSDGPSLMRDLDRGHLAHAHHFLLLPLLEGWRRLVSPLQLDLPTALQAFSAVAAASAVLLAQRAAALLGLDRLGSAAVAALVACCPAVAYAATVVEKYALYLAAASFAFWLFARLIAAPSTARAVLLGAGIGATYLVHAMNNLLPCLLLPLGYVLLGPRMPASRRALLLAVAFVVHVLFVWAATLLLRAGGADTAASITFATLTRFAKGNVVDLAAFPASLWHAWLHPYAPMSFAVWLGLVQPGPQRNAALALAIGLLVFACASFAMVSWSGIHGGYLLPLAPATAFLVVRTVRRRAAWLLVLISAVISVLYVRSADHPERSRDYVAGLREVTHPQPPFLLIAYEQDLEALYFAAPALANLFVPDLGSLRCDEHTPATLAKLDEFLSSQQQSGYAVILTRSAEAWLASVGAADPKFVAGTLLAHLRTRYDLEPLACARFAGHRLRPKP